MHSYLVLGILSLFSGSVLALLPQVSQEGVLRPYRSYADVTLFHYYVPKESNLATFEFAAFMDSPKCPVRNVHVFLQHGSYPVMSADDAKYPPDLYTNRTFMYNITLQSSHQPHNASILTVNHPLPGSWFAAGYLQNWDMPVQQEGLGHRCQYNLGSIAIWSQVANIESLPLNTVKKLKTIDHYSYYRFYIPTGTWEFTLTVDGCTFTSSRRFVQPLDNTTGGTPFSVKNSSNDTEIINTAPCVKNIFVQARRLPDYSPHKYASTSITEEKDSAFTHIEVLPFTDSYYYVLIESETRVSYSMKITTRECQIQMLGKSFIQRFAGFELLNTNMKEQAVRVNMSKNSNGNGLTTDNCKCVSIFRLTRVKHQQDFSDSFMLESKDWFTTWLALTDKAPVGVVLDILPYVDIGGTLTVSVHLDDMLMNATVQTVSVTGCIRKSRAPETFCCASANVSECCETGLTLQVSSTSFSTLDDIVLIPYPEPDNWYISFTTVCTFNGNVVPCVIQESLVSLDIRTQPCVLTKQQTPDGITLACGKYGYCQEVHKGQFYYTTCRCIGGYRGWACTDDSQATPELLLLATTLLLTLSNAFFAPAIFLACRRRMFTHALVYLCTMTASTLYHACDQDIFGYCLIRYQVLQFCDFFCSILSFWVTLISLAKCKYDSTLYMLGAIVIAVGVEYNRTGLMVFIVPFCLGIGVPVFVWSYRSVQSRKFLKPDKGSILLFIPGVLLGGAGLILFAFVETEENYRYTHSAWHAIIALSLVYLLPKTLRRASSTTNKSGPTCNHANGHLEVSNSAELASVSDPNTSTPDQPPVFFITSELDHLVQEVPTAPR